jgi:hypothetical protein
MPEPSLQPAHLPANKLPECKCVLAMLDENCLKQHTYNIIVEMGDVICARCIQTSLYAGAG